MLQRRADTVIHSTMHNQLKSPLLRLPAEIRNRIYEYTLHDTCINTCQEIKCPRTHKFCFDAGICQRSDFGPRVQIPWSSRCMDHLHVHFAKDRLQLLQVCQQIYAEAKLLVFSSNTLTGNIIRVDQFLGKDNWSRNQINAIRTVKLECNLRFICLAAGRDISVMRPGQTFSLTGLAKIQNLEKVIFHLICCGPEHEVHGTFKTLTKKQLEVAINEGRPTDKIVKLEYVFEQQ